MKITRITVLSIGALLCSLSANVFAVPVVDTIDASNGGLGTFFVPSVGQETDSPYYRGFGEDWGWTHGAIAAGFTSASLNISGFDVDEAPCGGPPCEVDEIQAFDNLSGLWVDVGTLVGENNMFSFTNIVLGNEWFEDIDAGLQVRMLIDQEDSGWFVSLAKSVLSTDGAPIGNPNPGAVPVPAAVWLFGSALIGLVGFSKRRKSA